MKLAYINPLGCNYKGEYLYEFLFTDEEEIEAGDDWAMMPASTGRPTPPPPEEIKIVGRLKSQMQFELTIHSDNHSYNDAIEGIVAVGWEALPPEHETRLVFRFDETMEVVKNRLNSRDLRIKLIKVEDDE